MELKTSDIPERDRLAYWTDALGRALAPATVAVRDARSFAGRIATTQLGYLGIVSIQADTQRMTRGARHLDVSAGRFLAVGVARSGHAFLNQNGRTARLRPGQMALWDTGRPSVLDHQEPVDLLVFRLPVQVLALSGLESVTAREISTLDGTAAALAPFLTTTAAIAADLRPDVADRLAGNVADLVTTLITEQSEPMTAGPVGRRALGVRVRHYVNLNLGSTDLTPEKIAAAHGISVRYLHRLFEGEGTTLGRWIQKRRLEESSRELSRHGGDGPPIEVVARRWGFASGSHFGRVFRATYGMTPREWRMTRARAAVTCDSDSAPE